MDVSCSDPDNIERVMAILPPIKQNKFKRKHAVLLRQTDQKLATDNIESVMAILPPVKQNKFKSAHADLLQPTDHKKKHVMISGRF